MSKERYEVFLIVNGMYKVMHEADSLSAAHASRLSHEGYGRTAGIRKIKGGCKNDAEEED